jgi:sec-independent protein translocase protein TatA
MPNVGPLELVVVLVIALIVLGPKKLPEVGRSLGHGIREFKDSISGMGRDDDEDDERERPAVEMPAETPPPVSAASDDPRT